MFQVSTQLEGPTAVLTLEGCTDWNVRGLELVQGLSNGLDEVVARANITTLVQRSTGE